MICSIIGVIAAVILILAIWIGQYNGLVSARNRCDESWSDVQTELKRRYDLIPNLLETVKGYMKHERELLKEITAMRESAMGNQGTPAEQARDEEKLNSLLDKLNIRLEAYPDLKASSNFLKLQDELTDTEDRIQASLRFYNANVREMNNKKQQFPSNIVAGIHGFSERQFFKVEDRRVAEEMKEPVKVQFGE